MRSKISVTFNLSLTRIWRARSPSVNATRVKGSRPIPAVHLFGHLPNHDRLTLEQAGPDALVLRTRGDGLVEGGATRGREQTFQDLLWGAHPRRSEERRVGKEWKSG